MTNIHTLRGIRAHNPNNKLASGLRLIRHGRRYRCVVYYFYVIQSQSGYVTVIRIQNLNAVKVKPVSIKYWLIRNNCRGFNNCHLILQMQSHVISFYGVTSRIGFMFLLFPQISRN